MILSYSIFLGYVKVEFTPANTFPIQGYLITELNLNMKRTHSVRRIFTINGFFANPEQNFMFFLILFNTVLTPLDFGLPFKHGDE